MSWGTATFNQNGGTGGETRTLYYNYSNGWISYWATAKNTGTSYRITSCSVPTKEGFTFAGYYSGNKLYVTQTGYLSNTSISSSSLYLTAKWVSSWKITLNANGGSGGTTALYYKIDGGGFYLDENLTQQATSIVVPTKGDHPFTGYFSNSSLAVKYVNENGSFTSAFQSLVLSGDITIYAGWEEIIDDFDYFGAANDKLMFVGSQSGAERKVVETSGSTGSGNNLYAGCLAIQTSESAKAAFWRGDVLVNPVCTYRIKALGSVSFQLGRAWNGTHGKYFLTEVTYTTGADNEPVLVLKGTANEGANAINLWTVTFDVSPDHIAQDPYSAISGGGELTSCTTKATCDPVVPYEEGIPCASDIVHGKIVVTGHTDAYFGESAPTANANNYFFETNGTPKGITDVDFNSYDIVAERSL